MTDKETVFIADGRTNQALAATRSLGQRGLSVSCGESFRHNPAFFSRHTRRRVVYADPDEAPERFLDDLEDELSTGNYHSAMPMRGVTTQLLVEHRQRFEPYARFCLPDAGAYAICDDKAKTAGTAMALGLSVPRTFFPEKQSLESIATSAEYPALIKPRVGSGSRGITYVRGPDELLESYPAVTSACGPSIVQEYIPDDRENLAASFLFNNDSELRATVVYEKKRMYPVRGGPSTLSVTVDRPDVVEYGVEFLKSLGWRGVANMGLVVDRRDNQLKLLEVNPRFWGNLALPIHAGVDFPYLWHRIALDGDVQPAPAARIGAHYHWLLPADVLWLLNVEKSVEHLREFLRFGRADQCHAICSASDPAAIVGAGLQAFHFSRDRTKRDFVLKRGW